MRWHVWPEQRGRLSAVAALAAGLMLRTVFLWKQPHIAGDTLIYADLAHNLLAHRVYGLTEDGNVRATLIRLPGYPLFLACCFALFGSGNFVAVLWLQVALDLVGCFLLYRLAGHLFGRRTALACLWLAALCPFTANYGAAALTETPSIFCVVLAFYSLVRWRHAGELRWAAGVGAAMCAAVLLRPDGILLSGAVLPAMVRMAWAEAPQAKRGTDAGQASFPLEAPARWYGPSLCAAMLAICLGSWMVRNWRDYQVWQPLAPKYANDPGEPAPTGFARWYRTWGAGLGDTARVYWQYDGSELNLRDLPAWAVEGEEERRETQRVYAQYNAEQSSTPRIEAAFAALGRERERKHPLRSFVGMPLVRLGDMWFRPRTELMPHMPLDWWDWRQRPRAALFAAGYGLLNAGLLGCACLGLWRWRRAGWEGDRPLAAAMVGYVVLRSLLLLTIDNSEPRYVLECYPLVILWASLFVSREAVSKSALRGRRSMALR